MTTIPLEREPDDHEPDEAPETPIDDPPPVPIQDPPPEDTPDPPMTVQRNVNVVGR